MALTERIEEQLEIPPDGMINVRTQRVIERDGTEIARELPHRRVVLPGADVSKESSERLKAIASVVWTQDVLDNWERKKRAMQDAFEARFGDGRAVVVPVSDSPAPR